MRSGRVSLRGIVVASAIVAGCLTGWGGRAFAGSDNSSDTYAGMSIHWGFPPELSLSWNISATVGR
jgi:hypothetical protein